MGEPELRVVARGTGSAHRTLIVYNSAKMKTNVEKLANDMRTYGPGVAVLAHEGLGPPQIDRIRKKLLEPMFYRRDQT